MTRSKGKQLQRTIGLTVGMLLIGWLSPGLGTAVVQKVDVCHRDDTGSFRLITVAAPAVSAHRQHGDALPSEPVPGHAGFIFDDNCQEKPATTCPCDFSPSALAELGIDMESLSGGVCTVSDTQVTIETPPPDIILSVAHTITGSGDICQIVNVNIALFSAHTNLTSGMLQDCRTDLLAAAPSLGIACD